ncbi:ubiquitin-conjugating enzyme E2 6 [Trichomonascus vanleenenianus]|uniref:ubiquitin-conjugating enzyme E2 n=1 Tax=Trichomonascus vanleenenianus TaxID=2268995 RepID=UPI003ECAA537
MASVMAHKRLTKEYQNLRAHPVPYVRAVPNDQNILEWHYLITGAPDTPYENGQYHGTLTFPSEYPYRPPSIRMCTPNGRFKVNQRLCLSISDFHPDTWNPAWSVSTILMGLLSFMNTNEITAGSMESTEEEKRTFARESYLWNSKYNRGYREQYAEEAKFYLDYFKAHSPPTAHEQFNPPLFHPSHEDKSKESISDNEQDDDDFLADSDVEEDFGLVEDGEEFEHDEGILDSDDDFLDSNSDLE